MKNKKVINASSDILVVNPLLDYGKGKIWDIVYNKEELMEKVNILLEYRKNNPDSLILFINNVVLGKYKTPNLIKDLSEHKDISFMDLV